MHAVKIISVAGLVIFGFFAIQPIISTACAVVAFVGRSAYLGLELGWFLGGKFWSDEGK